MNPSTDENNRHSEIEPLFAIANTLQTGLNRRQLVILLELIEAGVHPEALADVILEIRSNSGHSNKGGK